MTRFKVTLVVLSGVLLGCSFPPSSAGILAAFAFVPLFIAFEAELRAGQMIRYSYLSMFVFNLITLYWTGGFTELKDLYLAGAGMAVLFFHPLFFLVAFALFIALRKFFGYHVAVLSFPVIWVAFEYAHSLGEYAFPWLTLGNSHTYDLPYIQIASFTGVYGISFWLLSVNVLIYYFYRIYIRKRWSLSSPGAVAGFVGIALMYLLPRLVGFGLIPNTDVSEHGLSVSLVQPNIDPFEKWGSSASTQLETHLNLTREAASGKPDLIVWSETAIPVYLLHPSNDDKFRRIRHTIDSIGIPLLSGSPDIVYYDHPEQAPPSAKTARDGTRFDTFNSSILIEPGVEELQKYAKMKLVPFAERVPYSDILSFMNAMHWNLGLGGWGIGRDTTIFQFEMTGESVKFANLICYESIYPGFVAGFVRKGAQFLTIITNDSWWGNTSGAYQHKQIAIMRAIENRRWIARCANGGISCFIDPAGRTFDATELYSRALLNRSIGLSSELSFYSRHGDWFGGTCVAGSLILLFAGIGRKTYFTFREGRK